MSLYKKLVTKAVAKFGSKRAANQELQYLIYQPNVTERDVFQAA